MKRAIEKIKEIWNVIDVNMMQRCACNNYLWDWWMLVRNPFTYVLIAFFALVLIARKLSL